LYDLKNAAAYNQRALWVTGYASAPSKNLIEKGLSAYYPVEKVLFSSDPMGFFVFISEEASSEQKKQALPHTHTWLKAHGFETSTVSYTPHELVGVKALDNTHLEVTLEHPVPYFLNLTSFYTFKPVPQHVLKKVVSMGLHEDLWTRPEHIVTSGAFTLKEWSFRQHMVFEKNPRYWNASGWVPTGLCPANSWTTFKHLKILNATPICLCIFIGSTPKRPLWTTCLCAKLWL
jgi:hypothetical protein